MANKTTFVILVCTFFCFTLTSPANDSQETSEATFLQQIFTLKLLQPDINKIGVFCQVAHYKNLKKNLGRLQQQAQIEIFLYDIKKLPDVAQSLKDATVSKRIDVLWIFADEILLDPKTQSYLIKQSIQRKLFLLSAEPELVKKGATASIRKGKSKPVVFLNQKAIDLLAMNIPPELTESAEIIIF